MIYGFGFRDFVCLLELLLHLLQLLLALGDRRLRLNWGISLRQSLMRVHTMQVASMWSPHTHVVTAHPCGLLHLLQLLLALGDGRLRLRFRVIIHSFINKFLFITLTCNAET